MFKPCIEHCYLRFGKQYTPDCDDKCEYAKAVKERNKAVEFIKYLDKNYSSYMTEDEKFEEWRKQYKSQTYETLQKRTKQLIEETNVCAHLEQYKRLEKDFTELVMKSEDICNYCKNNIECKGKKCPKYIEGRNCWDDKRCHHDWDWSCKDFDFGTCDMLESTPCNGCFDNNNKGFEWRGNNV